MLTVDPRLTLAGAAVDQARGQILAVRNSPSADPDTVAALEHLLTAVDKMASILKDWEPKIGK